jgi:type II secretory ATPase GspE/PulE/Tfp pilus assembly ATPase PilB-like protein
LLSLNEPLREAILQNGHEAHLRQLARQHGLLTLRQAAWQHVVNGNTSLEEMHAQTIL